MKTPVTVVMVAHGGADGGRSHGGGVTADSMGLTNGGKAGCGGAQGGDRELNARVRPKIWRAKVEPEALATEV